MASGRPGWGPRRRLLAPALGAALALATGGGSLAETPIIDVTPQPLTVERLAGATTTRIADGCPILVERGDAEALAAARQLAAWTAATRGLRLVPTLGDGAPGARCAIGLARQPADLGPEGYRLTIGDGQAEVTAPTGAGLLYGAASLWQLMTPDAARGAVALQPMRIIDRPRFAWRGLLLDSARHYQSPEVIERLIDAMARCKLNVLQWHLTDDQGWRLEIKKYPRLTSIGAWRAATGPDAPDSGYDAPDSGHGAPARYGGFYSRADVRQIVAYAAARHVTIVPEIEMPGHSLAAILAYPELAAGPGATPALQADWGVFANLEAPSETTFTFLSNVLTEVMDLFPSRFIAIGGDEAVKDQWRASPAIQAQIRALGLANEDALQSWFTARLVAFLAAHGRRAIGWDDIVGGLDPSAAVLSWHLNGAAQATAAGHDAVVATDPTLYFDHRQSDLASEPPGRGIVVSLADVYRYEPAPVGLPPEERARFIGVQASLWTEHIRTPDRLAKMAFPRAAALAEVGWTEPERKNWPAFADRLPAEIARFRALGLDGDDGALAVKLDATPDPDDGGATLALSTQAGVGDIRYTLDGSPPGPSSPAYQGPVAARLPVRLRAAAFAAGRAISPELDRSLGRLDVLRRTSQELTPCTTKLALNLEEARPAGGRGLYLVDIMNPCWIYPRAQLTGMGAISIAVARLPFNFLLGADLAKIVLRPPATANGELEVRLDGCNGELLASLPLTLAADAGDRVLTAAIPPHGGAHDLCLSFTARSIAPLTAVDWLQLSPFAIAALPAPAPRP